VRACERAREGEGEREGEKEGEREGGSKRKGERAGEGEGERACEISDMCDCIDSSVLGLGVVEWETLTAIVKMMHVPYG